ncbi:esterase [Metabacillus sp. GX 13764]|uniref:esterase n=1 Tax=Metabacillus kandeliae TaxID=2900151 RepID=UPI001E628531|nr:esterase [Metabacillus kandeliae]MCD7034946.1 esterase [Metabacillus kandeliae]
MVIVEKIKADGVPLLHAVQEENRDSKTPFVMFVHGFTSAKEHNLHYAYLLAEKGFRVALPEAMYHGERAENLASGELNVRFWDIVLNVIQELGTVKHYFQKRNLIDEERIGVAGTSMGGISTLGALTQYPWIKAGVSLMGSPHYVSFLKKQVEYMQSIGIVLPITDNELDEQLNRLRPFDLSLHRDKLQNRPLLFWHGEKDPVVPFAPTYRFYEEVKKDYENHPENLVFIKDPNADHKVSREGLLALVDWFCKHL